MTTAVNPPPGLVTQGTYIYMPRAVYEFMHGKEDLSDNRNSDDWKLLLRFLLACNPYVGWEPSYEQVCRDFDRWQKLVEREARRAKRLHKRGKAARG